MGVEGVFPKMSMNPFCEIALEVRACDQQQPLGWNMEASTSNTEAP